MVFGHQLVGPVIGEEGEVFNQVQQASRGTGSPDGGFQINDAGLAFGVDAFPFGKVLPGSGDAADAGLVAVGEDNQAVVPKDGRDGLFVIAEVVVVGVFDVDVPGSSPATDAKVGVSTSGGSHDMS